MLSVTGSQASTIGQINPFRYRGYYYDTETGFYYLQSRYYDSVVGRFLNVDGMSYVFIETYEGINSTNLYAYCKNEFVFSDDHLGRGSVLAVGLQFAISYGNYILGLELLWDCDNNNFNMFLFAGGNFEFSLNKLRAKETQVINYIKKALGIKFSLSSIALLSRFSISLSGVAVLGNRHARFPRDYCGIFTSVSFSFLHFTIAGAISVCNKITIGSVSIGLTTSRANISLSRTYYIQLVGDNALKNNLSALKNTIFDYMPWLKVFAWFF